MSDSSLREATEFSAQVGVDVRPGGRSVTGGPHGALPATGSPQIEGLPDIDRFLPESQFDARTARSLFRQLVNLIILFLVAAVWAAKVC